jgi:chromosome segregation ATPase
VLTLNKLEKVIELEDKLRAEYQAQLDAKTAEIEEQAKRESALQDTIEELRATVSKQLETITDLSQKATANQRVEQLNRELTNRSEKLQDEVSELKKRVKSLQRDLAEAREENKTLKQFDPPRMKKNLDASKKKLADKTKAAELLQKSLNSSKSENAELQQKVDELEAKLAELAPAEDQEPEQAKEEAAA